MDCGEYVDLMTDYMEGDLAPAEKNLWEQHFDGCPHCSDFFHSFKSSLELIRYVEDQGCPLEVKRRLQKFMEARTNLKLDCGDA